MLITWVDTSAIGHKNTIDGTKFTDTYTTPWGVQKSRQNRVILYTTAPFATYSSSSAIGVRSLTRLKRWEPQKTKRERPSLFARMTLGHYTHKNVILGPGRNWACPVSRKGAWLSLLDWQGLTHRQSSCGSKFRLQKTEKEEPLELLEWLPAILDCCRLYGEVVSLIGQFLLDTFS